MANISKFEVFGPISTLRRMGEAIHEETPHVHHYKQEINEELDIRVFIYEDRNAAIQYSHCVTCIMSDKPSSVQLEIADVGRQSSFRDTREPDEKSVYDQVLDFILDFSKRYGLTVQNKKET